jgi:rubrerythrin
MVGQSVDTGPATIESLFVVAIQLELGARRFYEQLAQRFAHCPEVAGFWRIMAADEACHENRLIQWRASLSAARLSQSVDARMLQKGRSLLGTRVDELLGEVRNLDDAYETAHDLESSEINAIFRFFITEFSQDARVVAVLMQDLDGHAERAMTEFPARYATRAARVAVRASCS